ncbi:hypothetical protein ACWD0A_24360 [Streptomyces sp. NPDC002867]
MRTLFSDEVHVAYGQIYVCSDDIHSLEDSFAGQRAGLCGGAVPGHLFLLTGTHTGSVPITVELHATEPPLDADLWEDIVEVSFRPVSNRVQLVEWDSGWYPLPLSETSYRVRYHCRGMDGAHNAAGDVGERAVDEYLLRFWPSPPAPDRVVKETSQAAAYWHEFAREQPPGPTPEERAEAERRAREEAEHTELQQEMDAWGGRLPSDRLRDVQGKLRGFRAVRRASWALMPHSCTRSTPRVPRNSARSPAGQRTARVCTRLGPREPMKEPLVQLREPRRPPPCIRPHRLPPHDQHNAPQPSHRHAKDGCST